MTGEFLRNQWYTAATSAELGEKPLARTVCNEPLVIFRGHGGNVAVLSDRCPHRKAPLSSGEVVGNDIQCGYHGIRFAADGACTHVPGNAPIGRTFRARSFPARETHGLVFVWLGEPALADPALIPDFSENVKPGWTGVHGTLYVKANYQLLIDNILDLTHVVFVHKTTLAGGGVAETPLEVEIEGDVVRARRLMRNVDTAPIYKAARNLHGKIDRWQFLEFEPPIYARITLGAREAGSEVPFGTPTHVVLNSFTPETERTTHYLVDSALLGPRRRQRVENLQGHDRPGLRRGRAHRRGAAGVDRQRHIRRAACEPCLRPRRRRRPAHHQAQARGRGGAVTAGAGTGARVRQARFRGGRQRRIQPQSLRIAIPFASRRPGTDCMNA
jgi:nitrite reductase/ring-hydroxylating ferredoxin subunit